MLRRCPQRESIRPPPCVPGTWEHLIDLILITGKNVTLQRRKSFDQALNFWTCKVLGNESTDSISLRNNLKTRYEVVSISNWIQPRGMKNHTANSLESHYIFMQWMALSLAWRVAYANRVCYNKYVNITIFYRNFWGLSLALFSKFERVLWGNNPLQLAYKPFTSFTARNFCRIFQYTY